MSQLPIQINLSMTDDQILLLAKAIAGSQFNAQISNPVPVSDTETLKNNGWTYKKYYRYSQLPTPQEYYESLQKMGFPEKLTVTQAQKILNYAKGTIASIISSGAIKRHIVPATLESKSYSYVELKDVAKFALRKKLRTTHYYVLQSK